MEKLTSMKTELDKSLNQVKNTVYSFNIIYNIIYVFKIIVINYLIIVEENVFRTRIHV